MMTDKEREQQKTIRMIERCAEHQRAFVSLVPVFTPRQNEDNMRSAVRRWFGRDVRA